MKSYQRVKTIGGLSYTYFSTFWALRKDEEIGPKYPK